MMDDCNCTDIHSNNCSDECQTKFDGIFYSQQTIFLVHILYIFVLCTGIAGNFLTCTVICVRRSMRRSIHFYTFNLSVCDLLILLFYVPTQMVNVKDQLAWYMGLTMCKVAYVILPISLVSSVGTLLAITIDRTRGLLQPFKWRSDSKRNAKLIIPTIWILSILINIPLFILPRIDQETDGTPVCAEGWPHHTHGTIFWILMFVLVFIIPLIVITVAHVIMLIVMIKDKSSRHRQHNKRMIRMVVALVIVFSVCTGFQHIYFFIALYAPLEDFRSDGLLFAVSNFVVSLQAALNPVIYGTLRQDFKKAFTSIIVKLTVKLKLRHPPKEFRFRRGRMLTPLTMTFSSTTRSSSAGVDSPVTSPRGTRLFDQGSEPTLVHVRNNLCDDVSATLRRNLEQKYKPSTLSILEEDKNIYIEDDNLNFYASEERSDSYTQPSICDSPVPPSYITAIALRRKDEWNMCYVNKRFSRIIEYLNDSKETNL